MTTLSDLPAVPSTQALRSKADKASGRRASVLARRDETQAKIDKLMADEDRLDKVSTLFKTLIDREITDNVQAVEKLLTEGLRAVFDDQDLWVTTEVEAKHGKISVDLITNQRHPDGSVVAGISSEAFGGAVTTVQSVLLRLSVLLRRGLRPVIFLDESLPAINQNYIGNMAKFLQALCARMGVDILMVSHDPMLIEAAQKAYQIRKDHGEASFHLVR
jgi:hypothetical protein